MINFRFIPLCVCAFLLTFYAMGQSDIQPLNWSEDYKQVLDRINHMEAQGQNRSAYQESIKLLDHAVIQQNIPAIIAAINPLFRNIIRVEDDALPSVIQKVQGLNPEHPTVRAVVNSYLAEILTLYFEQQRYRLSNSQGPQNLPWSDLTRWSSSQFQKIIDSLYVASLTSDTSLNILSRKFQGLIETEQVLSWDLRPRLLDLLIGRRLEFLLNPRFYWNPVPVSVDLPEVKNLTQIDLSTYLTNAENNSYHTQVYRTFYEWEKSLLESRAWPAYFDVLVRRLDFTIDHIGEQYRPAIIALLDELISKYNTNPHSLIFKFSKGQHDYHAGNYREALTILESALKSTVQDSSLYYVGKIKELIYTIKSPELSVEVEDVYSSHATPFIAINFRNLEIAQLEVYPISEEEFIEWRYGTNRNKIDDILFLNKNFTWKTLVSFPPTTDYKNHRTEVLIDKSLRKGTYALRYWFHRNAVKISGTALFQISDLGLLITNMSGDPKLEVLDIYDGGKISGAVVEAITVNYHAGLPRTEIRTMYESPEGSFIPPKISQNHYYKVRTKNDQYISPLTYVYTGNNPKENTLQKTIIFTDRAVYKPGQIIHFKAMTTLSYKLESELVKNQNVNIILRDANYKNVWEKTFRTDEWGTVSGTIPVPITGLKGTWTLTASPSGHASVVVEDYQRPNFEVTVPDSMIMREGRILTLKGEAKTYHGFPVQNAQGTARVELERRYWYYSTNTHDSPVVYEGSFFTDEEGRFTISFETEDFKDSNNRYGSFLFYKIQISVAAASGEIRELTRSIPLDPDQELLQIVLPDFQLKDNLKNVRFELKNSLQQPRSKEVELSVSKLKEPQQFKVGRYWEIPDLPLLTEREFAKKIPHMFYDHQVSIDKWDEEKLLKSFSLKIEDQDSLDLKDLIQGAGYYRITIKDAAGDTIALKSFGIGTTGKKEHIIHSPVEITMDKSKALPGEEVRLVFHTPRMSKGGQIVINYPDGTVERHQFTHGKTMTIDVGEKDRGGIHIHAYGMLASRFYSATQTIQVPWTNKELTITGPQNLDVIPVRTDTSLQVSVKDHRSHGILSEVTTVIFDASLDAYKVHAWNNRNTLFRTYGNPINIYAVTGQLGVMIYSHNNYWEQRPESGRIIYPNLPRLQWEYRQYMTAAHSRVMNSTKESLAVDMAVPPAPMPEMEANIETSDVGQIRKDFEETILFVGKSTTDTNGVLEIPFRTNDKAGRWKIMVFAHSQQLQTGYISHTFETTQDLFVESFIPAVVRQRDHMNLRYTLFNNTSKEVSGNLYFSVNSIFDTSQNHKEESGYPFVIGSQTSTTISIPLVIDKEEKGPLIIRTQVEDHQGSVLDATEEVITVLPSSETIYDGAVFILKEGEHWDGFGQPIVSEKTVGEASLRIVQNMSTELLKSIPYMQIANPVTTDQFFRNALQGVLGQYITSQIPNFEAIYKTWKQKGELESRLAQNEDLKYATLENTPWVRLANSATEQMALMSLYFDDQYMDRIMVDNFAKWLESQNQDGGFPWIIGGPSSFYLTVRYLTQWNKIHSFDIGLQESVHNAIQLAQTYADNYFVELWEKMKNDTSRTDLDYLTLIPYFHQRAYGFKNQENTEKFLKYWEELKDSVYANWVQFDYGYRADIGIAAYHLEDREMSKKVLKSFVDNAIRDPGIGTYWKYQDRTVQQGYLGILSKISELLLLYDDKELNSGVIQWVLVNGMTNDWHHNPELFDLLISLTRMSVDWTSPSKIKLIYGDHDIEIQGLGDAEDIKLTMKELSTLQIQHLEGPPVWVGLSTAKEVESEDPLTQTGGILHIEKTVAGKNSSDTLRVGDQLIVQLRILTDRDLDYVYIQDPIMPGLDPGISLSGYQWNLGLFYYQTFDPSKTEMFIHHLPKGEYLLEYKLGVVRSGSFIVPRTRIQSYFVPEINGIDQWRTRLEINQP